MVIKKVKKGDKEYTNLDLSELDVGESVTVQVTKEPLTGESQYGKWNLFSLKVGNVSDANGALKQTVGVEASVLLSDKKKSDQSVLKGLTDAPVDTDVTIKKTKIEMVKYKYKDNKGNDKTREQYYPVYEVVGASAPATPQTGGTPVLPFGKEQFKQVAKLHGKAHGDVFAIEGSSYKISDYFTAEEYESD